MSQERSGDDRRPGNDRGGRDRMERSDGRAGYDIEDVVAQLERLESTVDSETEQREVEHTRRMLERVPGGDHIRKYTTRDIGEAVVGGIVFALPLLVEGGVFEIAEWFATTTVSGLPVVLFGNVVLTAVLTHGLLYGVDVRTVHVVEPVLGIVPRRLVGVLVTALVVAGGTMLAWGRLHEGDPTTTERVARVSVVWTAAAIGAVLGDILPGESPGRDINDMLDEEL